MIDNLATLAAAMPSPALIVDEDQRVHAANEAARSVLEMDPVGYNFARALRHPGAMRCLARAFAEDEPASTEAVLQFVTPRTFRMTAARIGEHAGKALCLFTLQDMSAEIAAERARSTFVANVSHELRSPLTALIGAVETLRGPARDDPKAQARFLELMKSETERMARLVGDLLSLAKLEAKEHVPPSNDVDLRAVIERVISSLSAAAPDFSSRVQIDAPTSLNPIIGDPDQLTEVFQNILENAQKYSTPDTPIAISISQRMSANRPITDVQIDDQGEGIDLEHLPRLTERFYRVDKGRSREMGGTGLGLAIVKHILNRHRAHLTIDSEKGSGTRIHIRF